MPKRLFIILLLSFLPILMPAGPVSGVPTPDPIKNRRIMDFNEDDQGYIWLGTDKGLFRYNGSVYVPYYSDSSEGLTSDFILSLCPDTENRLWVGTDNGICLIQDGEVVRRPPSGMDYAFSICNYSDSTLLYSTQEALYIYKKESGEKSVVLSGDGYVIPRFMRRYGEFLWIIQRSTDPSINIYTGEDIRPFRAVSVPPGSRITGMAESGGKVFISTDKGILCFSLSGEVAPLPEPLREFDGTNVLFLEKNKHFGGLLVGAAGKGLWHMSAEEDRLRNIWPDETLEQSTYSKILPARSSIWLYAWEKELKILYGERGGGLIPIPGVSWGEVVVDILRGSAGEAVIVTTSGLYSLDGSDNSIASILPRGFPPGRIFSSAVRTKAGDIFLLDRSGVLYRLRNENGRWDLVSSVKTNFPEARIWEDYEGHICSIKGDVIHWADMGGATGVAPAGVSVTGTPSSDSEGRIWFTGPEGIFSLDFGNTFNRLPLDIKNASCCLMGPDGNLIIGTYASGLYIYSFSDKSLRNFGTKDGLPDPSIRSMELDAEGKLWVSTQNYIVCLSLSDMKVSVFDYSEDFPVLYSRNCSVSLNTENGLRLVFAGDQAVTVADPSMVKEERNIPLSLDAVIVNNEKIDYKHSPIVLNHEENQLVFYYSGMDFQRSSQLNYTCRLEGFDEDWVYMGRNMSALYSNLRPGSYVFRARVYEPGGIPAPDEISFSFRIKPSFWGSWPMVLLYIIAAGFFLASMVLQIIHFQHQREASLLAEADRALAEADRALAESRRFSEKDGDPETAPVKPLSSKDKAFIEKIESIVEEKLSDEDFNATVLSGQMGMSYTRFYVKVKDLLEMTPQEYLAEKRLVKARELLEKGELNVSEVCFSVGFSSLPGFSRSYKKRFGVPPSSDIGKGTGE